MSVQVENLEKSMAKLTMEVGAEQFEAAMQKAYIKNKGRIQLPGFRKGKAPRAMIEKMYGVGVFYEDAADEAINETYADAMVEREKLVSTYMGMGVAIPHGTSQKKGTVKKSGVVLLQYPQGVDFGDEKAYLVFGIAGVGNDHLDLLGNVCEILEDEDALEQLKTTSDLNYVLEHLQ